MGTIKQSHDEEQVGKSVKDIVNEKLREQRIGWRSYIGIIFAIASSMMFELGILIAKLMPQYHPYNMTLWRFQGVLLPAIPLLFYFKVIKKQNVFDRIWPFRAPGHPKTHFLLFIRVFSGASAYVLRFYSLQYISMADCSAIGVSTPVFVSLASHFLLREKSGVIPIIFGLITLGGVAIITRPPMLTGAGSFDQQTLIGTGLASAAMLGVGTVFLLLRYFRQMNVSVTTAFFGLWRTIQCLALSFTVSKFEAPESFQHWWMAVAIAIFAFFEQAFITLAFKYEQAGTVALCRMCDGLFSYLWQFLFLGKVPDIFSIIGGGVVIFGVLVAGLRKHLNELPEDSQTRKRFWILLT